MDMEAGMTVTLHGLRARADLNGRTGVLLQWLEVGRWLVEMDGSMEAVRAEPERASGRLGFAGAAQSRAAPNPDPDPN